MQHDIPNWASESCKYIMSQCRKKRYEVLVHTYLLVPSWQPSGVKDFVVSLPQDPAWAQVASKACPVQIKGATGQLLGGMSRVRMAGNRTTAVVTRGLVISGRMGDMM
jgi:hypothetical protein